ncbi:MAG: L,D-transpeptidase family protein [Anaerobutyricum soehngenii]
MIISHIINYGTSYDNYNKNCVYKKGSAIFLHCTGSNPDTGGCVAVKQKYMKKIMQTVDKNAKICIYPK